jgi:hypothetical protein
MMVNSNAIIALTLAMTCVLGLDYFELHPMDEKKNQYSGLNFLSGWGISQSGSTTKIIYKLESAHDRATYLKLSYSNNFGETNLKCKVG